MHTATTPTARADAPEQENAELRELLRRWLRTDRETVPWADRRALVEDTKRALHRPAGGRDDED